MIRRLPLASLLVLLVGAGALAGSAPQRLAIHRRVLPNGLTVLVHQRRIAPVVTTMIWYRVGSRDELPGETGIAHFLEHLMFKGTARYRKGEIDRITYRNGGSNNAFTYYDYTGYVFSFPRDRWQIALAIEADRMRNTRFDPREFEAERKVVMEERRIGEDDPAERLYEQLLAITFTAHPYRNPVIGWMEDLRRLRIDQVKAFYDRYYVPANATLVITGDISPAEAFAAAERAFARVPRLPAPRRRQVVEPPQLCARRLRLEIPASVPRLLVSVHAPRWDDPRFYAHEVLATLLGKGRRSRLYQRLVERDALATDAGAFYFAARDLGAHFLYADLRPGADPDAAERAFWEELARLASEPVGDRELQRAKNLLLSEFIQDQATALDLVERIGEAAVSGGIHLFTGYPDGIRRVTPADVQAAAATLSRDRANVGLLWPKPKSERAARRGWESRRAARSLGTSRRPTGPRPTPIAPVPRFAPLPVRVERLPNGMKVMLLENRTLPTVTLATQLRAGSSDEPATKAGLAHFTAWMLDEGAGNRSEAEISEAIEFAGATLSAAADREVTTVTLRALTHTLPDLLPIYADLIRRPTFPADRLELQRERVIASIRVDEEDPANVARRVFRATLFGEEHPQGRPVSGSEESVRRLTRADLVEFHRAFYRPERATLVAVGDFDADAMLAQLRRLFADWQPPGPPGERPPLPPPPQLQGERTVRVPMASAQAQILLGHRGIRRDDPDYYALRVLDMILGEGGAGGFTARIPHQIRDVQGLAYSVFATITATAHLQPGLFFAAMGTEPSNVDRAVQSLLHEIRRIREQPVSETELREAIDYLTASYVFHFQTNEQLAGYLLETELLGLGIDYRQQHPLRLRRVTREQVLRAARAHLDPRNYVLVIVGPGRSDGAPPPAR